MSDHDSIAALTERIRGFNAERQWAQFHDPKNLVMALASEVGELTALLRWVRGEESDEAVRGEMRDRIEAEVGDVGILLLALGDRAGIDVGQAIRKKLLSNEARYPVDRAADRSERPSG